MNTLQNLPGGMPNVHIAVISSDMGAGDGTVAGCDSTAARTASSSTRRAAPARRAASRLARRTSRTSAASGTTRATSGRVHLHRGDRRERLRLRASVRGAHARARRRRARLRAGGESGLPAPRCLPGDRHDHQRGRLLRGGRRAALRHRLEHQHRVAARPARQLPLQRVRPPVQRRHGQPRPPEPQRPERRRERLGQLQLHVQRLGRLSPLGARHREPHQGAQGRSTVRSWSPRSPARRRPTWWAGRRRAPTRPAAPRLAPGR